MITVFAYISDISLNGIEGVEMIIKPSGSIGDDIIFVQSPLVAFSDENGFVSIDVVPDFPVEIKVPKCNFDYFIVTPASGSLDLVDLMI